MGRRVAQHKTWTAREIEALQHSGRRRVKKDGSPGELTADKLRDGGARGLILNVYPTGTKTWSVRYTPTTGDQAGHETEAVIGDFPAFLPKQAREAADEIRQGARNGAGVVIDRREDKAKAARLKLSTMSALADEYLTYIDREPKAGANGKARRKLRDATIDKNKQAIAFHVKPRLGSTPVERIKRGDVIKHADEIEMTRGPGAAHAFVAMTRRLLNFAIDRGLIEFNCALRIEIAQRESRDRVAKPKEIAKIWKALEEARKHKRGWMTASAIMLAMLTAKRRSEVAGIQESEIDWENGIWTISEDRAKNHKADRVPLTPTTLALLREARKLSKSKTHAFVGKDWETPKTPDTLTRMFARLRVETDIADLCLHDQRRTGATLMAQMGVDERTVSRILSHTPVGVAAVTGVYNRHDYLDEKREALLKWEAKLKEIIEAKYDDEVTVTQAKSADSSSLAPALSR